MNDLCVSETEVYIKISKMIPNQLRIFLHWAASLHSGLSSMCPNCNSCEIRIFFTKLFVKKNSNFLRYKTQLLVHLSLFVMSIKKHSHFSSSIFIQAYIWSTGRIPFFNFASLPLSVTRSNMVNTILFWHFLHSFSFTQPLLGIDLIPWERPQSLFYHLTC